MNVFMCTCLPLYEAQSHQLNSLLNKIGGKAALTYVVNKL